MRAVVGGWTEWGRELRSSPSNEVTMELNGSLSSAVDTSPTSFTYMLQSAILQLTILQAAPPPKKKEKKKELTVLSCPVQQLH